MFINMSKNLGDVSAQRNLLNLVCSMRYSQQRWKSCYFVLASAPPSRDTCVPVCWIHATLQLHPVNPDVMHGHSTLVLHTNCFWMPRAGRSGADGACCARCYIYLTFWGANGVVCFQCEIASCPSIFRIEWSCPLTLKAGTYTFLSRRRGQWSQLSDQAARCLATLVLFLSYLGTCSLNFAPKSCPGKINIFFNLLRNDTCHHHLLSSSLFRALSVWSLPLGAHRRKQDVRQSASRLSGVHCQNSRYFQLYLELGDIIDLAP